VQLPAQGVEVEDHGLAAGGHLVRGEAHVAHEGGDEEGPVGGVVDRDQDVVHGEQVDPVRVKGKWD
jgi:hypothetical protein